MGFFNFDNAPPKKAVSPELKGYSIDFLHRRECHICPLNSNRDAITPHMKPTGVNDPLVYMLGEKPSKVDDKRDNHFVGDSGRLLRNRIPEEWLPDIRWNYVVRTRPPKGRTPTMVEVECCRPSVVKDIEYAKPKAIFAFGDLALQWATNGEASSVHFWRGKRLPVKIGKHRCWLYPMLDPLNVLKSRKYEPKDGGYGSDDEFAFAHDLKRAFAEIESLPEPIVHTREHALANLSWVTGAGGWKDVDKVAAYLKSIWDASLVGMDYETKRKRPYYADAKMLSVAFSADDSAFGIALKHRQAKWTPEQVEAVYDLIEDFVVNAPCRKIAHNLHFEGEWSAYEFGRKAIRDRWECSMSQAYLLDERPGTRSLDFLCLQYFGLGIKDLSALDRDDLDGHDLDAVLRYNCIDAKYHRYIWLEQRKVLKAEKLLKTYDDHMRRIPASVLTSIKGVPIDPEVNAKFYNKLEEELRELAKEIRRQPEAKTFASAKGRAFNVSNPHDVMALLKLAGVDIERTKKSELLEMNKKEQRKVVDLILKWRNRSKSFEVYISSVKKGTENSILFPDGKVHPIITTTKVRTWRTSSEDPNIQNWTKHGEGKFVRKQVRPLAADEVVVAFDFAGIQARNVAMESKDKRLVESYWNHYDIHTDWRERVMRTYPNWYNERWKGMDNWEKESRHAAKNQLVFPTFFGAQAKTIAGGLLIPEKYGAQLREEFFDMFPEIEAWHNRLRKGYFKNGYVSGLSGHRRHAPIPQNVLINSPIQADESLIVCNAWASLSERDDWRLQPIFMIHDDLTFIWKKKEVDALAEIVVSDMLKIEYDWINVPLEVEMSIGEDWYSLKEVAKFETLGIGVGNKEWKQR